MRRLLLILVLMFPALRVEAATVKLTVEEPSGVERKGWPVTSGIPFAKGALRDHRASALFGPDGKEMPLQTEVLARWPDGSVRWLLLDFQIDLAAKEKKVFTLRCGADVKRAPVEKPLTVWKENEGVIIDTGPMRLLLYPKGFEPLHFVSLDMDGDGAFAGNELVTTVVSPSIALADKENHLFFSSGPASAVERVVEQSGPLRACVRVSGWHSSQKGRMLRYVARIHAFRGQPFIRFFYTFINDHQDSLMAKLRWLRLHFGLSGWAGDRRYRILDGKRQERTRLLQVDENHYTVDGEPAGRRAPGWAAIGAEKAGFAVGLREFWQNWPKSIEYFTVEGSFRGRPHIFSGLRVGICPRLPTDLYGGKPIEEENKLYYHVRDGVYTFKVGAAKTNELWANFYAGPPDVKKLSAFFQAAEEPLLATCDPAYVGSTKALGELPPADPKRYFGYDAWVDKALGAHLKRRDRLREYGMLNYGDWYGERRVNWGNLEYDLAHGLFLQYLRTGDRRFFLRAEQAARHHIDVDVVHATNPYLKNPWGPPPKVGEIWLHALNHTGGYYDEKTSKLPVSRTYHMGHSTNFGHVWVSGDLDYYYLTGDRRAREVSIQIADAMLRHMPNRYHTHIRALGWPMILVLAAYEATGNKKYLDAATRNWEVLKKNIDWKRGWVIRLARGHCLHKDRRCRGNVPFMEGLVCCALARYHRITNNPEVLRAITVGIDQMIRECWQEDLKTFRYTACPLSSKKPYGLFFLSAEAMAYEIAHTGNREHLRVLRAGIAAAIRNMGPPSFGKSLAQVIHFTPHALAAVGD